MRRGERLLGDGLEVINGDRQDQYGSPEDSFMVIAHRWTDYLRIRYGLKGDLSSADVAFMMADLKMARQMNQNKRDNLVDAVGYLGILDDLEEGK